MKIGIYGNCQTHSYAAVLQTHLPVSKIFTYVDGGDLEGIADCDLLFIQNEYFYSALSKENISKSSSMPWVKVPTFYFAGFQPDVVFERLGNGNNVESPAGSLNSAIILYGALHGLNEDQTQSLFHQEIYDTLGYSRFWDSSIKHMVANIDACDLPGQKIVGQWIDTGAFAHTVNHPTIAAVDIICRAVLDKLGMPCAGQKLPADPMTEHGSWPVYPGIVTRPDIVCDFSFRFGPPLDDGSRSPIDLASFIGQSYELYRRQAEFGIMVQRFEDNPAYRTLDRFVSKKSLTLARRKHVYSGLPSTSYWRQSISLCELDEVDPVSEPRFKLQRDHKIITAGSCFAQHIARTLTASGYNYYIAEPKPDGVDPAWAEDRGYGLFSARYGNIYTARQLVQLIERCQGKFTPIDTAWQRPDGRFVDPFRPQLEPDGFATAEEVAIAATSHLDIVRDMFAAADVFVFTLGLTETWISQLDGAVFPVAPGVAAGEMDDDLYRFVNFRCHEVFDDLDKAITLLRELNPQIKIILTVSPVPLVATYEAKHVLVATTYSKSSLRAAVDDIRERYDFVEYFPSYEIITGSYNYGAYYKKDRREVTPQGVSRVMSLLSHHFFAAENNTPTEVDANSDQAIPSEFFRNSKILCDEELLDR